MNFWMSFYEKPNRHHPRLSHQVCATLTILIPELTKDLDVGPLFDKSKHTAAGRASERKKATKVPKVSTKKRVTRPHSRKSDAMNAAPVVGSKSDGSKRNTRSSSKRLNAPMRQIGDSSGSGKDDASDEDSSPDYVDEDEH